MGSAMFWIALLAIIGYGIIHSLLAALGLKAFARRRLGQRAFDGFYRLLYNVLGAVTLVPVALIVMAGPARELWRVPMPLAALLVIIQLAALGALAVAVLQADPLRFAGLKQALAYLRGQPLPLPAETLQVSGLYSLVRHPLYLFSLIMLWLTPVMTDAFLGFAVGTTGYFVVGSQLEERRLAAEFGAAYDRYRSRVPWLLPWPRPRQ
jgi:protein-S-isoprenylcysteine O-methyltransferase Ste14